MHIDFDITSPEKELTSVKERTVGLSVARLLVFLLLGAVIVVGLSEITWLLALFFPLSIFFVYLIVLFNRQKDKQAFFWRQ